MKTDVQVNNNACFNKLPDFVIYLLMQTKTVRHFWSHKCQKNISSNSLALKLVPSFVLNILYMPCYSLFYNIIDTIVEHTMICNMYEIATVYLIAMLFYFYRFLITFYLCILELK